MNKEQVIDLEMSRINSPFQGLFLSLSNVVEALKILMFQRLSLVVEFL